MKTFLQSQLSAKVAAGRKLFVAYLTAGLPSPQGFVDLFSELSWCCDAIEVGIPFSDPMMDGPIIQQASMKALQAGVTVNGALQMLRQASSERTAPSVVMTYYNPIHHMGPAKFADALAGSGVSGLIVPDLPYEESEELRRRVKRKRIAFIEMVAPSTPEDRARMLAGASEGWVYAVSRLGVTGEQHELAAAAGEVVRKTKPYAAAPVLLGIGITNAAQARQAAAYADGVIVGSAIVKHVLAGDPEAALGLAKQIREALDSK